MRVLMTATSYPVGAEDWRGRFIYDMAGALARREDLALRVWLPPGPLPPGVVSACSDGDARWLEALQAAGGIAHLLRRSWRGLPSAFGLLRRLRAVYRREAADLVHVNWLQNALPLAGSATPALVTVLGSDFALLRLPGMAALLRRVLAQRRACLAPNAAWMVPELERRFGALTPREREVFDLVVEGCTSHAIASRLEISSRTVESYRVQIMEKMHAESVAVLVRQSIRLGRLTP